LPVKSSDAPSVVVNLEEAKGALTRPDTLHKTGIARREARETLRWLFLIRDAELIPAAKLESLIAEVDELVAMLTAGSKRLQERITQDRR
jgi:four helix bundle protein